MARESSVTHKAAITDHDNDNDKRLGLTAKADQPAVEENHIIDWDKVKVVDREAQRQTR